MKEMGTEAKRKVLVGDKEATALAIGLYGAVQKHAELYQLFDFLKNRPHGNIVELGTCHGGMTWFFAHLPDFKKIITVDLPGSEFGGGPTPHDRDVIKAWADPDYDVTLCTGNTQKEETFREVSEAFAGEAVDVLFIDADHSYEGVKRDFELWRPIVRNGGYIIFHDICDHSKSNPRCQVDKFWAELQKTYDMAVYYGIHETTDPDWGGIGIMEV